MNVKQFTRIFVVLGRFSLVSSLILVSSALGVMTGPLLSAGASQWEPYEPTGEIVVPATDKWVRAVEEEKDGHAYTLTGDGHLSTHHPWCRRSVNPTISRGYRLSATDNYLAHSCFLGTDSV